MRQLGRRRALDALLLPPFSHVHRLALHTGGHSLMLGACEPDGGAVLRNLSAEVEVIEVAGLTVSYDVAAGFNCLLNAA